MTTLTAPTARSSASAFLQSINPATGEVVGQVPVTPAANIASVVARARAASRAWRNLGFAGRRAAILPAGAKLVARCEELGLLLTREMGKPLAEGISEVRNCGLSMEGRIADIVAALEPDTLEDKDIRSTVYHDPFGVCAAITPWNFPMSMCHSLVIPALMAGNTVVLKPSEETPLIAQAYVDVLNETLPKDALQIVHGADEQGRALVDSDVDLIAFTGSRATGVKIMAAASNNLKRVILELGGKDPLIVLADADVAKAAEFAVHNSFRNAGQVCVSTERIYVEEAVADLFEQEVAKRAAALKVGPGVDEGVKVGPMINRRQKEWVLKQIESAVKQGARVLAGGAPASATNDNFVKPTVLAGLNQKMDIMHEETFGPVACIVRVKNADEAVALANDTPYGLGASVFGTDVQQAAEVGRRLDAGMIGINKGCYGAAGSPWVGAKQSGYGWHSGKEGHRQFTQPRVVSVPKQ